jgi:hypothetical protein
MAIITTYPQAMPNDKESTIVKNTAEEANKVLIDIFYDALI